MNCLSVIAQINCLSQELLGHDLLPTFSLPAKHTGERFGVAYLYARAGRVLKFDEDGIETTDRGDQGDEVPSEESACLNDEVIPAMLPAADSDSDSGAGQVECCTRRDQCTLLDFSVS